MRKPTSQDNQGTKTKRKRAIKSRASQRKTACGWRQASSQLHNNGEHKESTRKSITSQRWVICSKKTMKKKKLAPTNERGRSR
jgi:hypothetical protein